MRTPPPCCTAGLSWLRAKYGRGHLAALTGQDAAALTASIHVLELYTRADHSGKVEAINALRAIVAAMQPGCRVFVKEAIPYILDYADVDTLWPQISSRSPGADT